MKLKTIFSIPALVTAVFVASTNTSSALGEILTFDDLPAPPSGFSISVLDVPNGYGGLQWGNFSYMDGYASGVPQGVVSPNNETIDWHTGTSSIISTTGPFNLNSAYITAAWDSGVRLEVQAFGAFTTYDVTYFVNKTGPTLVNFNFVGVTAVYFTSFPTTSSGPGDEEYLMDNLDITFVPEPSTFALVGAAAMVLIFRSKSLEPKWVPEVKSLKG